MNALSETTFEDLQKELNLAVNPPARVPVAEPLVLTGVFDTTDYDAFDSFTANREVDKAHVARLVEAIKKDNLLHLMPIKVNAQLQVIDGQHRLEAARILGVPIYYQVADELSEEHIAILNANNKNWKGGDYLNFFTVKGYPAYAELSRFLKNHKRFSITTASQLVSGNGHCSPTDFKEGRFQAGHYEQGASVAKYLEQIADQANFKYAFDTRFVVAINYCIISVENFDKAVFLRKLLLQPTALVRCATQKQYLDLFEQIYNYKTLQENRIRFQ